MITNLDILLGVGRDCLSADRKRWSGHQPGPEKTAGLSTEAVNIISSSIELMRSHLNQPLEVSTLAAAARISPSHFFAIFKRLTGLAPIKFFIGLKMRRACDLLDETSLNICEVAAQLGYDDQFYFSRLFKCTTRIPPTMYRDLDPALRSAIKRSLIPEYGSAPGCASKSAFASKRAKQLRASNQAQITKTIFNNLAK